MIEVAKGFHELHNSLAETTHCFIMFATIYLVVSLCKPRTSYSVTALHTCMCMLGFSLGPITHRKFQITAIYVACLCSKSYCLTVASAWRHREWRQLKLKHAWLLVAKLPRVYYKRPLRQAVQSQSAENYTQWLTEVTSDKRTMLTRRKGLAHDLSMKLSPCLCSCPSWQTLLQLMLQQYAHGLCAMTKCETSGVLLA